MEKRKTCPSCGASNPADAAYCEQCGIRMEPEAATAQTEPTEPAAQAVPNPAAADGSARPTDAPQEPASAGTGESASQAAAADEQPQPNAAHNGQQPPYQPGYGYGAPQPNAAPDSQQPPYQPGYGYGAPQPNGQHPPYQPGFGYGTPGAQPPYGYGGFPRPSRPQFPFGQIDRIFGHFDGRFVPGSLTPVRSRSVAAILCLLLGPFGLHKFYTGQWGWGVVYLFLLATLGWTGWIWGIAYAVSLTEAILLFTMSNDDFQNKYHVRAS